jgi:TrmH family RNA methyltransferase
MNHIITSSENEIYKSFARLYRRKYREREGLYIIEGRNLIEEAVKNGAVLKRIFVREDHQNSDILSDFNDKVPVYVLSKALFDRIADTETPQGISAVSEKPVSDTDNFFRETDNTIVLDRLQDPGNIGTIIRTADAAGFRGAVIVKGTADLFSPKTVRAAAGSLYRVKLLYTDSPAQAAEVLRENGRKIVCTSPYADRLIYDADIAEKTALVIGNEANGICGELMTLSDINVRLPMEGNIESLNAAVAASVVMYESVRQRLNLKKY